MRTVTLPVCSPSSDELVAVFSVPTDVAMRSTSAWRRTSPSTTARHLGGAFQRGAHGQGDIQVELSLVDLGNQFAPQLGYDPHDGGEKCDDRGAQDDRRDCAETT